MVGQLRNGAFKVFVCELRKGQGAFLADVRPGAQFLHHLFPFVRVDIQ